MKILIGTLVILGMLTGVSFASDYYVQPGYDGSVMAYNFNTGSSTYYAPAYGGGYIGTTSEPSY